MFPLQQSKKVGILLSTSQSNLPRRKKKQTNKRMVLVKQNYQVFGTPVMRALRLGPADTGAQHKGQPSLPAASTCATSRWPGPESSSSWKISVGLTKLIDLRLGLFISSSLLCPQMQSTPHFPVHQTCCLPPLQVETLLQAPADQRRDRSKACLCRHRQLPGRLTLPQNHSSRHYCATEKLILAEQSTNKSLEKAQGE